MRCIICWCLSLATGIVNRSRNKSARNRHADNVIGIEVFRSGSAQCSFMLVYNDQT